METRILKVMDSQGLRDLFIEVDNNLCLKFPDKKRGIHIKEFLDVDPKRFYIQTDDEKIKELFKDKFMVCSSGVTMIARTQ